MTLRYIPFIVIIIINLLLDIYIYRQLTRCANGKLKSRLHVVLSLLLTLLPINVFFTSADQCDDLRFRLLMWSLYTYLAFYVPRLAAFMFWSPSLIKSMTDRGKRFARCCATVAGIVIFMILWVSALITPHTLEVREVTLEFDQLPAAFDDYRIVQFSDTHLGTYFNCENKIVERYVTKINALNPDMICFTGDLVNRYSREAQPYIETLSRLHARDGLYAISGNHDYADYTGSAEREKHLDHLRLIDLEKKMGWTPLENDHRMIYRGGDSVVIIGVGNYGAPVKPNYGIYQKAYPNYNDSAFKILMHHGPSFWENTIKTDKTMNVALTLSGHTHALQFMIKMGNHRWSPASWIYDCWGGEYEDNGKCLYVNIGLGMVGIPARIGATPELTVITLKKK